jgi:nitrate reductase delta subunit
MTDLDTLRRLGGVLAYPGADHAARAAECAAALAIERPAAAERLARFVAFALAAGADALAETYTSAFDLAPVCSPYVGDQLFGASGERASLLAGLRELERDAGLAPTPGELPDHVSEVLRIAAAPIPGDVREDLLRDGLVPCLRKMLAALEASGNPWGDPVAAALEAAAPDAVSPEASAAPAVAQVMP